MNVITTKHLTKYYGKSRGIVDVNLSVAQGDFFGFIGPNGAGKSTTIRTILGLIDLTDGTAQIFGKDIHKNRCNILSEIGYLPSETMFYNGMKVRDLIKFSADLRKKDCTAESKILCERFDLDMSKKVNELSLGNRKKVGIVCAMQHNPQLYILDEPTSGLDPLMQREFYSILKEKNNAGATIFLSSHVLSEVQRYCKHAAVIKDGEILVCDSVEKLSHTGAKRVIIRGIDKVPGIDGIKDVKITQDSVSFLYSGEINLLLKQLLAMPIVDLTLAEPDLEEVFMHYYVKEENRNDSF